MFLDNLSAKVRLLCEWRRLSYERASEQCQLSASRFGEIARGKASPTLQTLEKLCRGFEITPNELLLSPSVLRCPGCGGQMENGDQNLCSRCRRILDAAHPQE